MVLQWLTRVSQGRFSFYLLQRHHLSSRAIARSVAAVAAVRQSWAHTHNHGVLACLRIYLPSPAGAAGAARKGHFRVRGFGGVFISPVLERAGVRSLLCVLPQRLHTRLLPSCGSTPRAMFASGAGCAAAAAYQAVAAATFLAA